MLLQLQWHHRAQSYIASVLGFSVGDEMTVWIVRVVPTLTVWRVDFAFLTRWPRELCELWRVDCDELTMCRVDRVTTWPCDELTGNQLDHVAVIAAAHLSAWVRGWRWTSVTPFLTLILCNSDFVAVVDYTISYELTGLSVFLHLIRNSVLIFTWYRIARIFILQGKVAAYVMGQMVVSCLPSWLHIF